MGNADTGVYVPHPRSGPTVRPAAADKWPQKYSPDQVDLVDFRDDVRYFVDMSVPLTGFDRVELFGTGSAEEYLRVLIERVGPYNAYELYDQVCNEGADRPVEERVPAPTDRRLHAIAVAVTKMWYLGCWEALDHESYALVVREHKAHEERERVKPRNRTTIPPNVSFVVSDNSYANGLVWLLTTGHPLGAKPAGFGTWAWPPALPDAPEKPGQDGTADPPDGARNGPAYGPANGAAGGPAGDGGSGTDHTGAQTGGPR